MKVAIYVRVSTEKQSLENQRNELIGFCNRREYDIYNIYQDVMSGTKATRPRLQEMINDAYKKKFDGVVIWKLDRLGRSVKHLIDVVTKLEKWKVQIICYTQNIDTTTPQGKLFFYILSAFAEMERDFISERTKLGLKNAKNVGKRGKDKKPRKWRSDKGKKRGTPKSKIIID